MIEVICINPKASTKLIKGATYLVNQIRTRKNGDREMYIENVGCYDSKSFSLWDGSSLDSISDFFVEYELLTPNEKDYTDQFVKCRHDAGKYIKSGEIYYVEDQVIKLEKWLNKKFEVKRLKIRGVKNVVNPSNFIEIPLIEQRKLKLKHLNGGPPIITGEKTRKFLLYTEQEKINIIVQLLSKVLIDITNAKTTGQIDIKNSMLKKGSRYHIIEDDLIEFIDIIKPLLKSYNLKY